MISIKHDVFRMSIAMMNFWVCPGSSGLRSSCLCGTQTAIEYATREVFTIINDEGESYWAE